MSIWQNFKPTVEKSVPMLLGKLHCHKWLDVDQIILADPSVSHQYKCNAIITRSYTGHCALGSYAR